jgi:hypothetical protein
VETRLTTVRYDDFRQECDKANREQDFNNDFAHIQDPNERRRLALAEIDKAPFGWYHVRVSYTFCQTPSKVQGFQ